MPKKKSQKNYFGVQQEEAVIRYLESESENEKNKIFNEYLREPLIIMVESIIRRYKLYRKGYDFIDIHTDVMSFLITKIDKFDPSKNHKAYSYFGTICKNYLMGTMQKDQKDINKKIPYEDISKSLEEDPEMSYIIDEDQIDYADVVNNLLNDLENFIEIETLNENELKLGYALVEIFGNFEEIFQTGDGNKFNKNLILLTLREMTGLTTKEIRIAIKKFKKIYAGILSDFIN